MKLSIYINLILLFFLWKNNCIAQHGRHPNIIVIMADDMGYGDISALNPHSKIKTPVLDQMIKEGRHFGEAHTSASLCTPARYAFLTGRYNFRTGITGVASGYSKPMIEYNRQTIASLLKKAGYQTAIIGKWHLGLEWQPKDPDRPIFSEDGFIPKDLNIDYSKIVKGVNEVGFDYSFISPAGNNLAPFCFVRNGEVTQLPTDYFVPKVSANYTDNYEVRRNGGDKVPGYKLEATLSIITNEAVKYLENIPKNKKPFFLYLSLTAPHFPWVPQNEFVGTSKVGAYGDFVQEIDARVGYILRTLQKQNLDKNTLVIFTADNGGASPAGFFNEYGHEMNYGRKGQKGEIWEGGVRVPFITQWKGVIKKGSYSDQPFSFVDILATFAKITGVPLDNKYGEDSYDVSSFLIGNAKKVIPRKAMVNQSGNVKGLSITEGKWKLIPYGYGRHGLDVPPPGSPAGQLYNLSSDSIESKNLYDQNPQIVKRLSELLKKYKSEEHSRPGFSNKK